MSSKGLFSFKYIQKIANVAELSAQWSANFGAVGINNIKKLSGKKR